MTAADWRRSVTVALLIAVFGWAALIVRSLTRPYRALAILPFVLGACGQYSPPSSKDVNASIKTFTLEGATAEDGGPVECVMYGAGTRGLQDSKSWFAFDCDWSGRATIGAPR